MSTAILKTLTTIDNITSKINGYFSSIETIFSDIDRNIPLDEKISLAENAVNEYLANIEKEILEMDGDDGLKAAVVSQLKRECNVSIEKIIKNSMSISTILGGNREINDELINQAKEGDLELCYYIYAKERKLSSGEKISLLKYAADNGHPEAANEMSILLATGRHIKKDNTQAKIYAKKSFDLFEDEARSIQDLKDCLNKTLKEGEPSLLNVLALSPANDVFIHNRSYTCLLETSIKKFHPSTPGFLGSMQVLLKNYKDGRGVAHNKNKVIALRQILETSLDLEAMKYNKNLKDECNICISTIVRLVESI